MSDTVIKVENLSKKYLIGHQRTEKYQTFRDTLAAQVKGWGRRLTHPFRNSAGGLMTADDIEEFYALRDVGLEIKRGDRVGIIGRNGAGKSTLLKILSRITEPTSGRIEITGRLASLLEVGTGFHPELTGRENIFLNGAIMGMSREEIRCKFDAIVFFAEIERFLDTPVKRYSSGMYVRLAFAVAAHLEPEILIVDEVLAVGDAQFQKKCLGKMEEVGKEGRTVLFVSHNIKAIERLCTKGILVKSGNIEGDGNVDYVLNKYLDRNNIQYDDDLSFLKNRSGSGEVKFKSINISSNSCDKSYIFVGDNINFDITLYKEVDYRISNISVAIGIDNQMAERVVTLWSKYTDKFYSIDNKELVIHCTMKDVKLKSGTYFTNLYIDVSGCKSDHISDVIMFDVLSKKYYENGIEPQHGHGDILADQVWK